jgi:hypothetical protein
MKCVSEMGSDAVIYIPRASCFNYASFKQFYSRTTRHIHGHCHDLFGRGKVRQPENVITDLLLIHLSVCLLTSVGH